ncbi:hypothetical protein GGR73_001799 [Xanthomonas sp. F14]
MAACRVAVHEHCGRCASGYMGVQRPLALPVAHADVHPSQFGNFFATATFFSVTYFGNPSLP